MILLFSRQAVCMMDIVKQQDFPPGWDAAKVKALAEYYDNQSDEEALAEDEEAFAAEGHTLMEVPADLVPAIRELIAKYNQDENPDAR